MALYSFLILVRRSFSDIIEQHFLSDSMICIWCRKSGTGLCDSRARLPSASLISHGSDRPRDGSRHRDGRQSSCHSGHKPRGYGHPSRRPGFRITLTKEMLAKLLTTLLSAILAPRTPCKNGRPMCRSSICLGGNAIFLQFWI